MLYQVLSGYSVGSLEEVKHKWLVPSRCSLKHTFFFALWCGYGRQCQSRWVEGTVLHLNTHGTIFIVRIWGMKNLSCPGTRDGFMDLTLEGKWELSRFTCLRTGDDPLR